MVASNSLLLVALTAATAFASQPTPGSQIQTQYFHYQPAIESHEGKIQQRDPGRLSDSLSDSDLSNLRSNYCDGCSVPQFEQANRNNQKRELRYPLRMGDRPIVEARQYGFDDANQFHNQKRHVPYLMEKHEPSEELVQPQDGAENSDKEKRVVMLPSGLPGYERQSKHIEEATKEGLTIAKRMVMLLPGSPGYERQSKHIEEETKEGLTIAKRVVMLPPGSPGYERQSKYIEEATKEGLAIAKREPSPEPEDFNKREDASESITKPSWTGNVPLGNNPLPQNLPSEQKQGNEKRELKRKLDNHILQCSGVRGVCDGNGPFRSILEDINKNH